MNKTLYTKPDVLIVDMQVQEILAGTTIQTTEDNKNVNGINGYGFADENYKKGTGTWTTTDDNSDFDF